MKGFVGLWAHRHIGSGGVLNQRWPARLTLWRGRGEQRAQRLSIHNHSSAWPSLSSTPTPAQVCIWFYFPSLSCPSLSLFSSPVLSSRHRFFAELPIFLAFDNPANLDVQIKAVLFHITFYYNATRRPSFSASILTILFVQLGKSKPLNFIFTPTPQLNGW